jgi:hypothetical protein
MIKGPNYEADAELFETLNIDTSMGARDVAEANPEFAEVVRTAVYFRARELGGNLRIWMDEKIMKESGDWEMVPHE